MAIMDDRIYQGPHSNHYMGFENPFASYNAHASARSYSADASYSQQSSSSHIPLGFQQANSYHQHIRPQAPQQRNTFPGRANLQLVTEGPHDHDPSDYTAHPLRPNGHYSFNDSHSQSSKQDDDEGSVQSYDHSNDILPACNGFNRPLNLHEQERIAQLDRLKFFLATAPSRWDAANGQLDAHGAMVNTMGDADPMMSSMPPGHPSASHPALNRFLLPTQEYVSCVLWNGLYHITGTDIVRALVFRFEAFGRPVRNMKKFEEGIFSDLRNLKPGVDASLEDPKSPFLDLLFKYQCIRTQKKQKVFYWFSVPHDRLFLDALERDLKREKMGSDPTTVITGEPALSFTYDPKKSLYEQFSKAQGGKEGEGELEAALRVAEESRAEHDGGYLSETGFESSSRTSSMDDMILIRGNGDKEGINKMTPAQRGPNSAFFSMFSLFEGSRTYKQRRKKLTRGSRKSSTHDGLWSDTEDYGQHGGESVIDMGVGYGESDKAMTAADMFEAQAKGELGPANIEDRERERHRKEAAARMPQYPGSDYDMSLHNPLSGVRPSISNLLSRPLPLEHRHNSFPLPSSTHAAYSSLPVRPHALTLPTLDSGTEMTLGTADSSLPKTKVFVCPLYSCCRFFKRMEHLKRHLRTHTMERPYQCQRCKKRFSRSDNLTQHQRTHNRGDSDGGSASGYEDDQADIESGDEFGQGYNRNAYPNGVRDLETPDMKMCELEVSGSVQDVPGDEEGLVAAPGADLSGSALFASSSGNIFQQGHLGHDNQWAGSPMVQSRRSPQTASPFIQHSPSLYGSDSEFVTSISAPANKPLFDHGSLYPPVMNLLDPSGPGPIRRHRSMTPSLIRGESVRRPVTSTSVDFGSPARGYHPYAGVPGYVSRSSSSTSSSPANYPVPLDFPQSAPATNSISRSNSSQRGSVHAHQLQDQMHQMLSIDRMDDSMFNGTAGPSPGHQNYEELYRTDSPVPYGQAGSGSASYTGSPAHFNKQMPMAEPGMYAPSTSQVDQFAPTNSGYYSTMSHHHVTM